MSPLPFRYISSAGEVILVRPSGGASWHDCVVLRLDAREARDRCHLYGDWCVVLYSSGQVRSTNHLYDCALLQYYVFVC